MVLVVGITAALWAAGRMETTPMDKTGKRVDPGTVHTARNTWRAIATVASAGDEATDLGADELTYQDVVTAIAAAADGDEKICIYDIPRDWNAIRLRAAGITNDGTAQYEIYLGTLGDGNKHSASTTADCDLNYVGQLAFIIGTQQTSVVGTTYELADACTTTTGQWEATITTISPGGNRVAGVTVDLLGADVIVIVPTAGNANHALLAKGY